MACWPNIFGTKTSITGVLWDSWKFDLWRNFWVETQTGLLLGVSSSYYSIPYKRISLMVSHNWSSLLIPGVWPNKYVYIAYLKVAYKMYALWSWNFDIIITRDGKTANLAGDLLSTM